MHVVQGWEGREGEKRGGEGRGGEGVECDGGTLHGITGLLVRMS